jgi:undecaprenyl-diphosphatase
MSYLQAIVLGLVQGITELFPISSLGHGVLVPALLGWTNLVSAQTAKQSFFLSFLVGLHVGTAVALLIYYRRQWALIVGGAVSSVRSRSIAEPAQRLAWLIIVGTIPVGIVGLALEHKLRAQFAKPLSAAIFLTANGVLLLIGEVIRRRTLANGGRIRAPKGRHARSSLSDAEAGGTRTLDELSLPRGAVIGASQILALIAGFSRSGITMVSGISSGLDHEDAAQFSFLLATPVILLAGLYKLPELFGPTGDGIRMQCLVGAIAAGVGAFASVHFLVKWFQTKTLWPFGIYCIIVGGLCILRFS